MSLSLEIETPRLVLRQWLAADRKPFADMNTDARVTRYLLPMTAQESDALADRLAAIAVACRPAKGAAAGYPHRARAARARGESGRRAVQHDTGKDQHQWQGTATIFLHGELLTARKRHSVTPGRERFHRNP